MDSPATRTTTCSPSGASALAVINFSRLALLRRTVASPCNLLGNLLGILSSTTLTTPAELPEAYNKAPEPRTISTCFASVVSTAMAWSGDNPDMSTTSEPFCRIFRRLPSCPRMMGAEAPPPKWLE